LHPHRQPAKRERYSRAPGLQQNQRADPHHRADRQAGEPQAHALPSRERPQRQPRRGNLVQWIGGKRKQQQEAQQHKKRLRAPAQQSEKQEVIGLEGICQVATYRAPQRL
jgi:hypothetical protein